MTTYAGHIHTHHAKLPTDAAMASALHEKENSTMATIFPGRFTADTDGPFVVFIIGMRVNKPLAFSKWVPTMMAMGPMLQSLAKDPESGYLGGELFFYPGGIGSIQYWRSTEDLERFARAPQEPHLKAWQRFNKAVGKDGSVGIWHETYQVAAGAYESIYANMPRFGLSTATSHVPVGKRGDTARERLKA